MATPFAAAAAVVNQSNKFRGGGYANRATYDNSAQSSTGYPSDPALIPIQSLLDDGWTWAAVEPSELALLEAAQLVDEANTLKSGRKPAFAMDARASEVYPVAQVLMSDQDREPGPIHLPKGFVAKDANATPTPAPTPAPALTTTPAPAGEHTAIELAFYKLGYAACLSNVRALLAKLEG